MNVFHKGIELLDRVVDGVFHLGVVAAILIVLHVCVAIFSRYVLQYPLNWIPGVVILLTDWAVFLIVGVYLYRNQGIIIPYFYERFFSVRMKRVADILSAVLMIVFTSITGWFCWGSMVMGNYLSSLSTIPIEYYWYTVPFFFGMLLGLAGSVKRLLLRQYNPYPSLV